MKALVHQTYIRPITMVSGFSFVTFNALAEGYYDQQSCPKTPYINWKDRWIWFKQSLRQYNSSIVCLQQIDYGQQFSDYLQSIGYLTFYNATPKITPKETRQGQLIAVKQKQFNVVKSSFVYYNKQNPNHQFVFVQLQHKQTKKHLFVFSTHLKAQESQQQRRFQQIKVLRQYINLVHTAEPTVPIIITGDLNTQTTFESYKRLRNIELLNGQKFQTVYPEGDWTLHKIQNEQYLTIQIDHILYKGLNVIAYQKSPNIKQMLKSGLPDVNNPSDHIPLYAIFTFK